MKMRALILGSAHYMKEWVVKNKARFSDYLIFAMNNAWFLAPEDVGYWLHSSDFFVLDNTLKPSRDEMARWNVVRNFISRPFWYHKNGSWTMILNSLYHVLNSWNGELLEICLAGCDLVYPTEKSHFYEKGTADPLRLGQEYLIQELVAFKNTAERAGVRVLNVGGQEESLLPFERAIF